MWLALDQVFLGVLDVDAELGVPAEGAVDEEVPGARRRRRVHDEL